MNTKTLNRPVTVYEYWRPAEAKYNEPFQKREIGSGSFHQWGAEFEEFTEGPGNRTIAIVELLNGEIITPLPELIRFEDKL